MIKTTSYCVCCENCIDCGRKKVEILCCDECGEEADYLYKYEFKEICEDCLHKKFEIIELD